MLLYKMNSFYYYFYGDGRGSMSRACKHVKKFAALLFSLLYQKKFLHIHYHIKASLKRSRNLLLNMKLENQYGVIHLRRPQKMTT